MPALLANSCHATRLKFDYSYSLMQGHFKGDWEERLNRLVRASFATAAKIAFKNQIPGDDLYDILSLLGGTADKIPDLQNESKALTKHLFALLESSLHFYRAVQELRDAIALAPHHEGMRKDLRVAEIALQVSIEICNGPDL